MGELKPVIYIIGPTASGKTGLSISLAKEFGGEIVSADSMQIYSGMHIASAAPDDDEKCGVAHHLFEFLSPQTNFSVSQYVEKADSVISDIHSRGALPFVVGGTGLYVSSLSEHIDFGDDDDNSSLREELYNDAENNGLDAMYQYLCKIDPEYALKISKNDKKRILRAIEVFKLSGKTMSERIAISKQNGPIYDNLFICLGYKNRELLYDRINKRVDVMLQNGLLEEAKNSFEKSLGTASQAIGHKELFEFFSGNKTLDEAVEHLKMQTRRYAKRQITWFKKMPNLNVIYMDEDNDALITASNIIKDFLK